MATFVNEILERLKASGPFNSVTRINYTAGITAEEYLVEARAVGEYRSGRFTIDSENVFTYTNLAKWFVGDVTAECLDPETRKPMQADLRKGFYIAGPTGSGKTWAAEILSYLARLHNFKFKVGDTEFLLGFPASHRADEITDYMMREGDLMGVSDFNALLIHDLGSEPSEVLYMGNRVDAIRQLIERRGDSARFITSFTSNLRLGESIAKRYGDRVDSRLREMCNYYEIKGYDRRK